MCFPLSIVNVFFRFDQSSHCPILFFFPTHCFLLSFSTFLTPLSFLPSPYYTPPSSFQFPIILPALFHLFFSSFYHLCPHHWDTVSSLPMSVFLPPVLISPSPLPLLRRVWEVTTGEVLNTLIHHNEAVLHLRFANGLMVTCSKDRSIAVWDMASPTDISLRRVLVGHRAAVNVVDFDDKYIVSASGDRTIKVTRTVNNAFKPMTL